MRLVARLGQSLAGSATTHYLVITPLVARLGQCLAGSGPPCGRFVGGGGSGGGSGGASGGVHDFVKAHLGPEHRLAADILIGDARAW